MGDTLVGNAVTLRDATPDDVKALARIREKPEVYQWWRGGEDLVTTVTEDLADPDTHTLVIEHQGDLIGEIQWAAENDPDYRHASIDIYLDPAEHGKGLGTDALRTLVRHLLDNEGHHRITIDPATDNTAAIACYTKVGFQPVGVMRQYERGADGSWHDGLLMDLLADELTS